MSNSNAIKIPAYVHTPMVSEGDELSKEYLQAKVDAVKHKSQLTCLAYEVEARLGELEKEYWDTDILDGLWGTFCQAIMHKAPQLGIAPTTKRDFKRPPFERPNMDLMDNFFSRAVSLAMAGAEFKNIPAVAWAAYGKHHYPMPDDEIACCRFLIWAGFSVNARDAENRSPLHYLASMKVPPFAHARGLRILLGAGANANIKNFRGETPLIRLCRSSKWTDEHQVAALTLMRNGANPTLAADDGKSAADLIAKHQWDDVFKAELLREVAEFGKPAPSASGEEKLTGGIGFRPALIPTPVQTDASTPQQTSCNMDAVGSTVIAPASAASECAPTTNLPASPNPEPEVSATKIADAQIRRHMCMVASQFSQDEIKSLFPLSDEEWKLVLNGRTDMDDEFIAAHTKRRDALADYLLAYLPKLHARRIDALISKIVDSLNGRRRVKAGFANLILYFPAACINPKRPKRFPRIQAHVDSMREGLRDLFSREGVKTSYGQNGGAA